MGAPIEDEKPGGDPTASGATTDFAMVPHPERLDPGRPDYDEIMARHRRSVAAGADTYRDPATGFFVFTAAYLWARGYCCDNHCRHCPYVERPRSPVDPRSPR